MIFVDLDTKLNVLNEFSMQRFASKWISNIEFTLKVPTSLTSFKDAKVNFHGETEYGKADGFGFIKHKSDGYYPKNLMRGAGEIKNGMFHGTLTIYYEDQSYAAI